MRASTEITLAGHAAARLFARGGAGGVALTVWALRRSGMERADAAARMTTLLVLLYADYMAALVLVDVGLFAGVLPGTAPLALIRRRSARSPSPARWRSHDSRTPSGNRNVVVADGAPTSLQLERFTIRRGRQRQQAAGRPPPPDYPAVARSPDDQPRYAR